MAAALNPARRSMLAVVAGVAALAGLVAWTSSIGGPHGPKAGLVSVLYLVLVAGPPVLAYVLGAIGLGSLFARFTQGSSDPGAIQAGLGLGLMLSLSHALGVFGLLSGSAGVVIGGGVVVFGLFLLARRILAHVRMTGGAVRGSMPWPVFLGLPALAVLVTAACSPPGWLWDSEARGYDAMSYHLELPQEWLEAGRIWPRENNVYSYLPGYVEAAFTHIGAMGGAPATGRERSLPMGLLAVEGHGVITCQLLHAALAVLAAVLVGRMAGGLARGGNAGGTPAPPGLGALAGVLFLSIPWVIVTGSLAYNEMGMAALFAAAVIAAGDRGLRRRGVMSGLLVGFACGCKPTAIFLCAPVVGVMLAGARISRGGAERQSEEKKPQIAQTDTSGERPGEARAGTRWWKVLLGAMVGGLVAILPWMIRNWAACGNPVFPMGTGIFGAGHWGAEQVQRYVTGHRFDGGMIERVYELLSGDRGVMHPQWAVLPAVGLVGLIAGLLRRHTHIAAAVLSLSMILQLGAWLMFTHLQSRFLLPLAVTGCGAVAVGLAAVLPGGAQRPRTADDDRRRGKIHGFVFGAGSLIVVTHVGMAIGIFSGQSDGKPNQWITSSPWLRSGELDRRVLAAEPGRAKELAASAWPEVFVNVLAAPGTKVYLLGDGAPLYYTCPVLYNTTWDKWPLGEAMRRSPGKPAAWTRELWEQGVRLVLVNAAEIDRLQKSGWADPMVTNDAVNAWLKEEGRLVRSWPEIGVGLFELKPPGAAR